MSLILGFPGDESKVKDLTLLVTNVQGDNLNRILKLANDCIQVPTAHAILAPGMMLLPLQLLAYHIALIRDCDVDQPRNLAKSVTAE